jgi:hypothetical protein
MAHTVRFLVVRSRMALLFQRTSKQRRGIRTTFRSDVLLKYGTNLPAIPGESPND